MFVFTEQSVGGDFRIKSVIRPKTGSNWNKGDLLINLPLTPQSTSQVSESPDSQSQPSVQGVEQPTPSPESLTSQTSFSLFSDESLFEYEDYNSLFSTCQRWHFEDED
jgi:hypothetical protein